jgi:hypothetical protein
VTNFTLFDADPNYLICGSAGEIIMLNITTFNVEGKFSNEENIEN